MLPLQKALLWMNLERLLQCVIAGLRRRIVDNIVKMKDIKVCPNKHICCLFITCYVFRKPCIVITVGYFGLTCCVSRLNN